MENSCSSFWRSHDILLWNMIGWVAARAVESGWFAEVVRPRDAASPRARRKDAATTAAFSGYLIAGLRLFLPGANRRPRERLEFPRGIGGLLKSGYNCVFG